MSDQIRVNGNILSWGSIKMKFGGEPFFGFTSVQYADKRERVFQWGMGKHHAPRARSRGKYTPEPGKLGGPKSTIQALREFLAAQSADGASYGDVHFDIVIQYVEADDLPITVELEDCVITGNSSNEEENPDPLKEEIEISYMKVRRNGVVLFDETEGSP